MVAVPIAGITSLVQSHETVIFLDTARPDNENKLSYIFVDPIYTLVADSCDQVGPLLQSIDVEMGSHKHWICGYLAYEAAYALEKRLSFKGRQTDNLGWFGIFKTPYIFDHQTGCWNRLIPASCNVQNKVVSPAEIRTKQSCSQHEYSRIIGRIKNRIARGETYQVNFTTDVHVATALDAWDLYCTIRQNQCVAYSAFVKNGRGVIASFSPELFFSKQTNILTVKPMKGTAPRGRFPAEDKKIIADLKNDPKSQSENVMIVDLLRNDLGRICARRSIAVEKLFAVETHPTLHQMTSTISGRLLPQKKFSDIIAGLFPCGSVTGAPKIQTMQIISQLEKGTRGVYCGALGYMSPKGDMTFSVPIRTLIQKKRASQWRFRVGSGIVWDSTAHDEWHECGIKTSFLTRRLPSFDLLESFLLFNGKLLYKQDHVRRMAASAAYFGFPFQQSQIAEFLLDIEQNYSGTRPHKVRFLYSHNGPMNFDAEDIVPISQTIDQKIFVSSQRTDSSNPFLFHKTTHRPWYEKAMEQIKMHRCFDVIFQNEKGEITEGARSNVFIEKNGVMYTPPITCGLLAGVLRSRLVRSKKCCEKVLHIKDLKQADAIWCGNSVRGMVKVSLGC